MKYHSKVEKIATIRLIFISLLFSYSITSAETIDSLLRAYYNTANQKKKVDLLNNILNEFLVSSNSNNTGSIERFINQSLQLARRANYKEGEALTYYTSGKIEMSNQNHLDKATLYFLKSLSLYEQLKDEV